MTPVARAQPFPGVALDGRMIVRSSKGRPLLDVQLSRRMCEVGGNTPVFFAHDRGYVQLDVSCPDSERTVVEIRYWEASTVIAWAQWVQQVEGRPDVLLDAGHWRAVPPGAAAPSLELAWDPR